MLVKITDKSLVSLYESISIEIQAVSYRLSDFSHIFIGFFDQEDGLSVFLETSKTVQVHLEKKRRKLADCCNKKKWMKTAVLDV